MSRIRWEKSRTKAKKSEVLNLRKDISENQQYLLTVLLSSINMKMSIRKTDLKNLNKYQTVE